MDFSVKRNLAIIWPEKLKHKAFKIVNDLTETKKLSNFTKINSRIIGLTGVNFTIKKLKFCKVAHLFCVSVSLGREFERFLQKNPAQAPTGKMFSSQWNISLILSKKKENRL